MNNEIVKIDFNGDALVAFEEDDKIYVSVSQACNSIGLAASSQTVKIKQDPVMQSGMKLCVIANLFGGQETPFLERKHFHRWLNSVQPARVKNDEVRDKLVRYQFECIEAIDDYFSKGSAINETFLKNAPQEFVNNLAETIAAKLGIPVKDEASIQKQRMELALGRLDALKKVEDMFGRFDNETRAIMQQQTAADIGYNVPTAPTWTEIDRWYAADFWEVKKTEGWKNAHFKSDAALVLVLGRYASRISRAHGYEILDVPQVVKNGRKVTIHQYREEALELAFDRLIEERKVAQQKVIQMARREMSHD